MKSGLLVVVAVLGLSACSGSSTPPTPSSAPSPSPAESPAPTPSEVSPTSLVSATPTLAPGPTAPVAAAVPRCTTAQLRLTIEDGDGGAGQFHQPLLLVNRGPRCSLLGFPGVSFVDSAGRTLGSPAEHSTGPVRRVLLAPGRAATAVLTYSNAGAYPDSSCHPVQADRVRVYPPGDRDPLLVADPILICSATGSGQLHIGPVEG